jgi:hypothetical protein
MGRNRPFGFYKGDRKAQPQTVAERCYGAKTLGNNIYVRRETLRLLIVFCTGPFWYTQQLYFHYTLRLYIRHNTDTIMTQYDTGRTETPFRPFDVCIWMSPFLIQDSPIEGTPHQCLSCGICSISLSPAGGGGTRL